MWPWCIALRLILIAMQARLPTEKVVALRSLLHSFGVCLTARLQEWQSLIGTQSLAGLIGQVVRFHVGLSMLFVALLIHIIISVSSAVRHDRAMWLSFLESYNGVSLLCDWKYSSSSQMHFSSDTSD